MTTAIEYALMAGHAYRTTRDSVTIKNYADGQLGLVCSLWNGVANDARYGNSFDRRVV